MSDRANGLRSVPIRDDEDIWRATHLAVRDVVESIEPDAYDDILMLREGFYRSTFLHFLQARVLRVEPTLSPDHRLAVIEVTGCWTDGTGETTDVETVAMLMQAGFAHAQREIKADLFQGLTRPVPSPPPGLEHTA